MIDSTINERIQRKEVAAINYFHHKTAKKTYKISFFLTSSSNFEKLCGDNFKELNKCFFLFFQGNGKL